MRDDPLSFPAEREASFGTSFLFVMAVHLVLVAAIWAAGKFYFKHPAPEPITWLDGGGELGSAAPTEEPAGTPVDAPAPVVPEVAPPTPPEVPPPAREPSDFPPEPKAAPTPTPRPKPTQTPALRHPTPAEKTRPKPATSKATPKPANKPTSRTAVAKLVTPRSAPKVSPPKAASPPANPAARGSSPSPALSGSGDATNIGKTGGPGAAGGSKELMTAYFKKVTEQFRHEWQMPLTGVRSGTQITADVRLRAGPDGTVEALTLEKPTGNLEVDKSIEKALRNVRKVDHPPAELLKGGVLDEQVAFILDL